jgi:hypothetical protein
MSTVTLSPSKQAAADLHAAQHTLFVRNILAVYYSASLADIQAGNNWYNLAQDIARTLAATYDVPLPVAAGIIAATSPQKEWSQNVALAEQLLAAYTTTGQSAVKTGGYLPMGLRKADQIFPLGSEDVEQILAILNGDKTKAFFLNILGDMNGVCVDGHAQNIALNGLVRKGITQAKGLTPLTYQRLTAAYQEAAATAGTTPAQLQAITWVAYKNLPLPA